MNKRQIEKFRKEGLAEKQDGWYIVPGRVDRASYGLLAYFVACVAGLGIFYQLL